MNYEKVMLWPERSDVVLTAIYTKGMNFPGQVPVRRPAVIVCPGGGYIQCEETGGEGDVVAARFFADGYQAFILEYTVSMKCGDRPTAYPIPMYDLAKAFLTIQERADEWNVDTERIAICGFSAGGHLCSSWAVHWKDVFLTERFGVDSHLFKPAAAILGYPVIDTEIAFGKNRKHSFQDVMTDHMIYAIYGTTEPSDEQLHETTCKYYLSQDCPPVFIAHALDDTTVSVMQSIDFARACIDQNVSCELRLYERGGHGFGMGGDMIYPARRDNRKECGEWFEQALKWLSHQLYPETKEKMQPPFGPPPTT